MITKFEISCALKAIKYAVLNPRETFGEFLINPIKLLEMWYRKSFIVGDFYKFNLDGIPKILNRIGDEASKVAYLKELCFRALCAHSLASVSGVADKLNITISKRELKNRQIESSKINLPYKFIDKRELSIINMAQIYPQYIYSEYIGGAINKDEVILDCGSYIGDTALWFEKHLGENGKIYSFEAHPQIREILSENIKKFSTGKIDVAPYAVSDCRGIIYFSESAYAGARSQKKSKLAVQTISLDEFCLKEKTPSIIPTLIKMDVEGAELSALIGAKEIITKYKPKLAICTYHETPHLWEIPEKIMEYSDDYVFYFKKHNHLYDAVIYAFPKN